MQCAQVQDEKGFTLAELLIVVAIIAVLVAVAIPVMSGALAKATEAACKANRTYYYVTLVSLYESWPNSSWVPLLK